MVWPAAAIPAPAWNPFGGELHILTFPLRRVCATVTREAAQLGCSPFLLPSSQSPLFERESGPRANPYVRAVRFLNFSELPNTLRADQGCEGSKSAGSAVIVFRGSACDLTGMLRIERP